MIKTFDTNIGSGNIILTIPQALVELIINSLEEGILSQTEHLDIKLEESGVLYIIDKGRGIPMKALVFCPNPEKTDNNEILGQFGSGMKDAIASLYEKGVRIRIKTRNKNISFNFSSKIGYSDIKTLHAVEESPSNPNMEGTEIILTNISPEQIETAKDHFLCYTQDKILVETDEGQILEKTGDTAKIYYRGTQIAKQNRYLFSYNIKEKSLRIKKALTRDKRNLSSNVYSRNIGKILKSCKKDTIINTMIVEFKKKSDLDMSKDICRLEVQEHLAKILHSKEKVVYLTPKETARHPRISEIVKEMGYHFIHISEKLKSKLSGKNDYNDTPIRDYTRIKELYQQCFQFNITPIDQLDREEKRIFTQTPSIISLLSIDPAIIRSLSISNTMRKSFNGYRDVDGLTDINEQKIIIKRSVLKGGLSEYSGVLGHEIAHISSRENDISRGFESELTRLLGIVTAKALKLQKELIEQKEKNKLPS